MLKYTGLYKKVYFFFTPYNILIIDLTRDIKLFLVFFAKVKFDKVYNYLLYLQT